MLYINYAVFLRNLFSGLFCYAISTPIGILGVRQFKLGDGVVHGVFSDMDIAVKRHLDGTVTQHLLQNFGIYASFDGSGGVGVAQGVHGKMLDPGAVAELVEMGIVAAVLDGHSGAEIDEYQIPHDELLLGTGVRI